MNVILLCRTQPGMKDILPYRTRRTKCGLFCYARRSLASIISFLTEQDARSAAYKRYSSLFPYVTNVMNVINVINFIFKNKTIKYGLQTLFFALALRYKRYKP